MPNDSGPAALTTTLVMSAEQYAVLAREQGALEVAQAYTIVGSPEEQHALAQEANDELKSVTTRIERIEKLREGFIEPAITIIDRAKGLFNPALASLKGSSEFLRKQLADYTQRTRQWAAEAEQKRQADERAARQKAEQEAAAERARAQEKADAARREAEEAEQRRQAAVKEGNKRAAAAAAAEAAKLKEKADAAIETGEANAQKLQLAAAAAPADTPAPAPTPRLAGFSTRDNWCAELAPNTDEDAALEKIIAAIAGVPVDKLVRRDMLALLKRDESSCNKLAKAQKDKMHVPGLVAVNKIGTASRRT